MSMQDDLPMIRNTLQTLIRSINLEEMKSDIIISTVLTASNQYVVTVSFQQSVIIECHSPYSPE